MNSTDLSAHELGDTTIGTIIMWDRPIRLARLLIKRHVAGGRHEPTRIRCLRPFALALSLHPENTHVRAMSMDARSIRFAT